MNNHDSWNSIFYWKSWFSVMILWPKTWLFGDIFMAEKKFFPGRFFGRKHIFPGWSQDHSGIILGSSRGHFKLVLGDFRVVFRRTFPDPKIDPWWSAHLVEVVWCYSRLHRSSKNATFSWNTDLKSYFSGAHPPLSYPHMRGVTYCFWIKSIFLSCLLACLPAFLPTDNRHPMTGRPVRG